MFIFAKYILKLNKNIVFHIKISQSPKSIYEKLHINLIGLIISIR